MSKINQTIVALLALVVCVTALYFAWERKNYYEAGREIAQSKHEIITPEFSADRESADWNFGILITSILTVSIGVMGTYYVVQSLKQSVKANELGANNIYVSERAWVSTTPIALSVAWYHEGYFTIDARFCNKNNGKTPALEVHTHVKVVSHGNEAKAMQDLRAAGLATDGKEYGIILAPDETFNRPWGLSNDDDAPPEINARAGSMVVGVISYKTIFSDKVHQTGFVYAIVISADDVVEFRPWSGSFAT